MFSPISARSFLVDSSIYVYREACESFDFTCDGSACSRPTSVSLARPRQRSVMTSVEPTSDLATMRQRTSCMHLSV
jgi:hypothetical protein